MKIFISFSHKDKDILQSFVDHYLKLGLGIKNEEIFCTGIDNSKPKTGEDFRVWIKENIQNSDLIILLISRNYKNSEVCLNEMGASWILDKRVFPLLLPPIDFDNVGFLHNSNQVLKINSRNDLFKLYEDLNHLITDRNINSSNLNNQIDKFLNEIGKTSIFKQKDEEIVKFNQPTDNSYFDKFLIKDIDYRGLLLKAQPTLSDCKSVFNDDFYKDIYDYYNYEFKSLLEINNSVSDLYDYNSYDLISATYDDLSNNNHNLPGGMTEVAKKFAIKKNSIFYTVRFKRKEDDYGTTFTAWVYINNRWVLFIKPWWIVNFIYNARENKGLNRLVRIFKKLGIFKKYDSFELKYLINRVNE